MSMPRQRSIALGILVCTLVLFASSASASGAIYWTQNALIGRANNDGTNPDQTFIGELGSNDLGGACGVAVDGSHIWLMVLISIGQKWAGIGYREQI